MTGQLQTRLECLTATRVFQDGAPPAFDLGNVIPFARARRAGGEAYAPPVTINPADRLAPRVPGTGSWLRALLLLLISLIAHSSLLYLFWQEPQPLLGIGTEAITVELEIGDSRPVGATANQGAEQVDTTRVDEIKGNDNATEVRKATEAPEVKPEERRTDAVKEQLAERPKEQKREERPKIAMVETQQAEVPTVRPRETPPDMRAVIAPPEEIEEAKPVESRQKLQEPIPEQETASGIGLVVSTSAMASYNGKVFAQLKRHQQYPDAARDKLITGRGAVAFEIDAIGKVISASVAVSSGAAVLDQEMTAMAFRASPFPAPPDGRPKKFSAPVVFEFKKRVQ